MSTHTPESHRRHDVLRPVLRPSTPRPVGRHRAPRPSRLPGSVLVRVDALLATFGLRDPS